MLGIAGRMASGTVTWMTGPDTIEAHIVPTIREAAAEAGRPEPRIGVGLPVCVTDDADAARDKAAELFAIYGHLPSYRAMLDREGAAGPGRCGHRRLRVRGAGQIRHLADIGVTDFCGAPFGSGDEIKASIGALAASIGSWPSEPAGSGSGRTVGISASAADAGVLELVQLRLVVDQPEHPLDGGLGQRRRLPRAG